MKSWLMDLPLNGRFREKAEIIWSSCAEEDEYTRLLTRLLAHFADDAFHLLPSHENARIFEENPLIPAPNHAKFPLKSAKTKRVRPAGLSGGPR
ncbi:hypothetical protein [Aquisediminimonas profunda]|uniref:hypothetical protein n=1 Tax=Aquisediminimonas profunda TaxID=1550733 RepID=UPI001C6389FB|nr:hypothetical protein [Aquisediminimonas profunda]